MIDGVIGLVAGIVIGHYFPMAYTWVMGLFSKAETTVESAATTTTTTDTTTK